VWSHKKYDPERIRRDCYHLGFSMGERRRFDFYEHPTQGDEAPPFVIASEGNQTVCWWTDFFDPWNCETDLFYLEEQFHEALARA
jgi:hypothetical protein